MVIKLIPYRNRKRDIESDELRIREIEIRCKNANDDKKQTKLTRF